MKGILAVLAAVGLVACGGGKTERTGGVSMDIMAAGAAQSLAGGAALIDPRISTSVTLKIDGPGDYDEVFTSENLPWRFSDNPCPVGHYTFEISAQVGSARFEETGSYDITAGEMTHLGVVLMQQTNATPMQVKAPFISKIAVSGLNDHGSGGWGVPIKLKATVDYPDNDRPDMDWFLATWSHTCIGEQSSGKEGRFTVPYELNFFIDQHQGGFFIPCVDVRTDFTSYCQGKERITLQAVNTNNPFCSHAACELISRVSFDVDYDPQGVDGEVKVNFAPQVSCDRVDNAEPLPSTEVAVKAFASDAEGDAMTFAWSDDCGGTFVSGAGTLAPTWKAPAQNCKVCVLRLDVTDARGGENYGTISVKTAPADVTQGCVVPQ